MLGVLITLAAVVGCAGLGGLLVGRWTADLDPAARFGLRGLVGLGALGTLTFFLGFLPGGFSWGVWLIGALVIAGLALLAKDRANLKFGKPAGPEALGLLAVAVAAIFALVSVLAPSDTDDWDTLAYHLAVPKLWIAHGGIYSVPSLHHSNFPDVVDDLYVWGLTWGGQQGAKAFSLGFLLLGLFAIFGLARQAYGPKAGWWSAVAFATVPVVLSEAGSAYIDLAHGLYAGLAVVLAAMAVQDPERKGSAIPLAGILLGLATASKYTGLQTILALGLVLLAFGFAAKNLKSAVQAGALIAVIALAIASPWYVKNAVLVKNPVYPFLYERLGGKDWDQRRADIYRNEQQTFGVGRTEKGRDPLQIGHAVLGLSYQPGRYVNPRQDVGLGSPFNAIGVVVIAALVLWPLSGRLRKFEGVVLGTALLSFGMWFFLSQQSRYITTLAPPAAILAGGAIATLGLGRLLAGIVSLQAAYTLYLFQSGRFTDQIQVVTGKVTPDEYQTRRIAFYPASQEINRQTQGGKVALYDEVFGYLLDVPYMWANPGHSTIIPYDGMQTADDYVREMKRLGFTHAYIAFLKDPTFLQQWIASMGLEGAPVPLPEDVRAGHLNDWQTKWEVLLADAVAQGKLRPVARFRKGILFRFE